MGFRDYLIAQNILQQAKDAQAARQAAPHPTPALFASEHTSPGQTLVNVPPQQQMAPPLPPALQAATAGGSVSAPPFDVQAAIAALSPGMQAPNRYGVTPNSLVEQPGQPTLTREDAAALASGQPQPRSDSGSMSLAQLIPILSGVGNFAKDLPNQAQQFIENPGPGTSDAFHAGWNTVRHPLSTGREKATTGTEFVLNKPREANTNILGNSIYSMSQGGRETFNPTFYAEMGLNNVDVEAPNIYTYAHDPKFKAEIEDAKKNGYKVLDENGNVIKTWAPGGQAVWEKYQSHQNMLGRAVSSLTSDPWTYPMVVAPVGDLALGASEKAALEGRPVVSALAKGLGMGLKAPDEIQNLPFKGGGKLFGGVKDWDVARQAAKTLQTDRAAEEIATNQAEDALRAYDQAMNGRRRGPGPVKPEEDFGGKPPGTPSGKYSVRLTDRRKGIGFIEDPHGDPVPDSGFSKQGGAAEAKKKADALNAKPELQPATGQTATATIEKPNVVTALEEKTAAVPSRPSAETAGQYRYLQVTEGSGKNKVTRWELLDAEGNSAGILKDRNGLPFTNTTGDTSYGDKQAQKAVDQLNEPILRQHYQDYGIPLPKPELGLPDIHIPIEGENGLLRQVHLDHPKQADLFDEAVAPGYRDYKTREETLRAQSEEAMRQKGAKYNELTDFPRAINEVRYQAQTEYPAWKFIIGGDLPKYKFKYGDTLNPSSLNSVVEHAVFGTPEEATKARRILFLKGNVPIGGEPDAVKLADELSALRESLFGDTAGGARARAGAETVAREVKTLPPLTDNYLKDLSHYTDTLYRESDIEGLDRVQSQFHPDFEVYLANTPDLATGQGTNKGVLMEFDAKGIQGQVNRSKPGWDFSYKQGNAEFIAKYVDRNTFDANLKAFTIQADAKTDAVHKSRLKLKLKDLEDQGWKRIENADGSVTYLRPDTSKSAKTAETVAEAVPPPASEEAVAAAPEAAPPAEAPPTTTAKKTRLKASEVPEELTGTSTVDRAFNEGKISKTAHTTLSQEVTHEDGTTETMAQMFERLMAESPPTDQHDFNVMLEDMSKQFVGKPKYRVRLTNAAKSTGYILDPQGTRVAGSEFTNARGLNDARQTVITENKPGATKSALRRALGVYDNLNMGIRENQQYNMANALAGGIGDSIGNATQMIASGRPMAAIRSYNPVDIFKTFRATRAGDSAIFDNIKSFDFIHDTGSQLPNNLTKTVTGRIGSSGQRLKTHALLDKATTDKYLHAPFEVLSSHTGRDLRNAIDQHGRLVIYADTFRQELPKASRRFQKLLQDRYGPEEGRRLFTEILDTAKARIEGQNHKFIGQFSPEDVESVTGRTDLKRAWTHERSLIEKKGTAAEEKILFSYRATKLDEQIKRVVFFHYWQSRAIALHARAALENPALAASYWRSWQALKMQAKKDGYPPSVQGFLSYMGDTAGGWAGFMDPLGIAIPFTIFRDSSGGDENWFERIAYVSPLIQAAFAAVGSEHFYHPDITGTSKVKGIVLATINEMRAHGIGPAKPVSDPVDAVLTRTYQTVNEILGHVGATKGEYQPTSINESQKTMIKDEVYQLALLKYGDADKWSRDQEREVNESMTAVDTGAKGYPLAEQAFTDFASANLKVKGSGILIPQGTRIRYSPLDDARAQQNAFYAAQDAGTTPTDQQQAAVNELSTVNAGSPETRQLQTDLGDYNAIGTEKQQNLSKGWNNIANGTRADLGDVASFYTIDGQKIYVGKLMGMKEEDRKTLADRWVANHDGTAELQDYRDQRDAFKQGAPELLGYKDYQDYVYNYEGKERGFRNATERDHPEFKDELDQKRDQLKQQGKTGDVLETELDKWATGTGAYDAFRGTRHKVSDTTPQDAWDPSQTNTLQMFGNQQQTETPKTSGSTKSRIPTAEDIKTDIADYEDEVAVMSDLVGQDVTQINNPLVQQALTNRYGTDITPTMPKRARLYLAWAQHQPAGADSSEEAYVAYLAELKAKQEKGLG